MPSYEQNRQSARNSCKNKEKMSFLGKYIHIYAQNTLKLFVDTCPTCQQIPEKKPKHVGATKPIISNHFRDRMQVDLIDYSSDPQKDQNDVEMKWLMVVKDHFTKLVYLRALPSKHAVNVSRELEHLFGLILHIA